MRGVERGGRQWTAARSKDSLQRVLDGSRSDAKRLQQRLTQLAGELGQRHAATPASRPTRRRWTRCERARAAAADAAPRRSADLR